MRREFEITVYPDGRVRIERRGDSDDVCVQEVLPISEVLGELTERRLRGTLDHHHNHAHVEGRRSSHDH